MRDLRKQYPDAFELIIFLPSWSLGFCFKPEAHLLIEKFLSLKNEKSRDFYTANMIDYNRVRHDVSSIFLKFRGTFKRS